jgi:hypothetical protein
MTARKAQLEDMQGAFTCLACATAHQLNEMEHRVAQVEGGLGALAALSLGCEGETRDAALEHEGFIESSQHDVAVFYYHGTKRVAFAAPNANQEPIDIWFYDADPCLQYLKRQAANVRLMLMQARAFFAEEEGLVDDVRYSLPGDLQQYIETLIDVSPSCDLVLHVKTLYGETPYLGVTLPYYMPPVLFSDLLPLAEYLERQERILRSHMRRVVEFFDVADEWEYEG